MAQVKIIFLLSHAFNPNEGGVQRTTIKLGKYFSENGFSVFYYSLAPNSHTISSKEGLFYPGDSVSRNPDSLCKHLIFTLRSINPHIIINQMPYEKLFQRGLKKYRSESKFYLIGCLRNSLFSFKSNIRTNLKSRTNGLIYKILATKVGVLLIQQIHYFKHKNQLNRIIELHDDFVLLTPPNEEELKYFIRDFDKSKVKCIPNSIPFVCDLLPSVKKQILFVGNLNVYHKRVDLLIPFWKSICNQLTEWNFVIVGDGPLRSVMQRQIQNENIPRVSLTGRIDPERFYKESAIFIMTSAYEGFPNVLLEAQSFGLASIVFNSYMALDWIANNNKDTFFVKPFDLHEMARVTLNLCNNEQLLINARNYALLNARRFTTDKIGLQWLELFEMNKQRFLHK